MEVTVAFFCILYGPSGTGPQWYRGRGVRWVPGSSGLRPPGEFEGQYASEYTATELLDLEPDFSNEGESAYADWLGRYDAAKVAAMPPDEPPHSE